MFFPKYYTLFLSIASITDQQEQSWNRELDVDHKNHHHSSSNNEDEDDFARQYLRHKIRTSTFLQRVRSEIFGMDAPSSSSPWLQPTTPRTTTMEDRITKSAAAAKSQLQSLHQSQDSEMTQSLVSFEFMKEFMTNVFVSYGVSQERAEICADVLVESDRRGIDSHGIGRLKPIYCDRMDSDIVKPDMPIDVIRETETTALLDGNMGLGLYIGPYCMQMAIDKAKQHGVGFVAVSSVQAR
jgi:hypothetical protein